MKKKRDIREIARYYDSQEPQTHEEWVHLHESFLYEHVQWKKEQRYETIKAIVGCILISLLTALGIIGQVFF